ncbi:class I SAM-dependent methyltransferase [Pseudomonas lurida]|uniref:O-methyltransferase n=1 Tax=Pseudomonas lurida TaxID=244566 RepID=UPI001781C6BC|nr:class I SAM-dependent methyltransferase [Pseudomonas lurida]MBD8666620.1 class I SAM-dependent methyltransferase [Pseudomonas lurida]UZQ74546.1 class I SAM-dependent methyltransferase [Pseudomonas lurida]
MSSLTSAPLAPLIERLYTQASAATSPVLNTISKDERERLMHSKTEYVALYSMLKDLWLPVSRDTGKLLYMLARSSKARAIVEFGTSFGLSTLHLAAALRDNGGGVLVGSEFEASKIALAREHFIEGGVSDLIHIREGDALVTLASDLPDSVDLLLLDGAKTLYGDVPNLVESHLRPGALVVADNTDYCPEYLAHVRAPENGYLSVAFADDVELSIRLG